MAALEQVDALRKQNKDLVDKLKEQAEKLRQVTLSWRYEEDNSQSSEYGECVVGSVPARAPFTERNGLPPRVSPATSTTTTTNIQIFDEHLQGDCEKATPEQHTSGVNTYSSLLQDTGNSRWTGQSRSVRLMLPTPATFTADGDQRETDSATTAGLELDAPSSRHIQPLLGYDWIAGLLDAESSLADRSEQFFGDLRSFRQINREECVHRLLSGLPSIADLASSTLDGEEPETPAETHQCTFCYRINSRLFAVPLDAQVACPVCKTPKSEHPHTEKEPAIVRVSIPRSTLLPAYKYKGHRRSSFDPSDSLGLPSHCLSGWSNPTLISGSQVSSLDLHSSMEKHATTQGFSNKPDSSFPSVSRYQDSDQLQNVSRLPRYNFQHLDPNRSERQSHSY